MGAESRRNAKAETQIAHLREEHMTDQLTDADRAVVTKRLAVLVADRILQKLEADRTALVKERDEVQRWADIYRERALKSEADCESLHGTVKDLTAERDEARLRAGTAEAHAKAHDCRATVAESEHDVIHEKLRDAEAEVARLTAERDLARRKQFNEQLWADKCAEVARLTEALAAAERERDGNAAAWTVQLYRANAAEQKLAEAEQRADDLGRLGKEHIEQLRELLDNSEKNLAFVKSEHAAERVELLRQCDLLRGERDAAERRWLAEAERAVEAHAAAATNAEEKLCAAVGRVRELEADLDSFRKTCERLEQAENTEISELRARVAKALAALEAWPLNCGLAVVDAASEALRNGQ